MDPLLPARGNLVGECVRVMRARIGAGEWAGGMPGERRLAGILQVGRDTVRLALQQLEQEGVVSGASAGSRRKVIWASATSEPRARGLRVGLLSVRRLEHLPQQVLLEVDHLRGAVASRGGSLEVFAPPWYESPNPDKRLAELLATEPCSVWILHRSSAAIQGWFERTQLPCLIRGYPHPGIGLPHLDVDWQAVARHAASMLWRLGHRRVAVLVPPDLLRGVQAAVEGACELREADFEALPLAEDGSTAGLGRVLARALQAARAPTAVIATRPRQAATALTWLTGQGLRVPHDISLVSLAHEPFLDHLVPEVTSYRVDPEKVARLVVRRLERIVAGQRHPGGTPWITPDASAGASVGRPR